MATSTDGGMAAKSPAKADSSRKDVSREQVIWDELQHLGKVPMGGITSQHVQQAREKVRLIEGELRSFRQEKPELVGRWEKRAERARVLAQLLEAEREFQKTPEGWGKRRIALRRDAMRRQAGKAFGLPRVLSREDVLLEELQAAGRLPKSPIPEPAIAQARQEQDDAIRAHQIVLQEMGETRSLEISAMAGRARTRSDAASVVLALLEAQRTLEAAEDEEEEDMARLNRDQILKRAVHYFSLSAICLSGGGIRSASFSLGILQGLARCSYAPVKNEVRGVLPELSYLSTVSGGGYIGSWLTRWSSPAAGNSNGSFESSVTLLAQGSCEDAPEACPVKSLRDYTSYLSPKRGLSGDFLALLATYLRNLLLNWTILLPSLLLIALLPAMNAELMMRLSTMAGKEVLFFTLAGVALLLAMAMVAATLPARRNLASAWKLPVRTIAVAHTYAFLLGAYFLACWAGAGLTDTVRASVLRNLFGEARWVHRIAPPPASYALWVKAELPLLSIATLLAMIAFGWWRYPVSHGRRRPLAYWFAYVLSAAVAVGLFYLAFVHVFPLIGTGHLYPIFAVPLMLLVVLLTGSALTGLLSSFELDEDREWLARSGGMLMAWIVAWIVVHSLVLKQRTLLQGVGLILAAVVGPLVSWAGFSPSTASGKTQVSLDQLNQVGRFLARRKLLLPAGAALFLLLSLVYAAAANDFFLDKILPSKREHVLWSGILLLGYFLISFFASRFVNLNTFSMHGLYRNRLMRAYLGASNQNRTPDPYTNFDPDDNMAMAEAVARPKAPLHMINVTVNLVGTRRLAWQERKAESFTVSALHCGSFRLGYRRTETYAGYHGPTLATAMAISGAAATPNMGYHSSPLVTLLMTLFNVRLGWWWPNPGRAGNAVFRESNPRDSLRALLREAAGKTNDTNPWIYVSDGGHFENLGLYEMVLRRCHNILVVDGSADPNFKMEDLGSAFRKIQIDFGIPIELCSGGNIHPGMEAANRHCAVYAIRYACIDGDDAPDGTLVYIKASLCSQLSEDVMHYASAHPSFPHEPTANQFFGESQFESYRRLGMHVIEHILNAQQPGWFPPREVSLEDFIQLASRHASGQMAAGRPSAA